jgi:hypothetical protein
MLYLLSQNGPSPADQKVAKFVYDGDPANKEVRVRAWFFFVCWLLNCRTRSEDSADQGEEERHRVCRVRNTKGRSRREKQDVSSLRLGRYPAVGYASHSRLPFLVTTVTENL